MLISPAYAQSLGFGDPNGLLSTVLPLVLMLVVFYFLLIRPQQQKSKEHKTMLGALRRGDRVVTGGGIIGTIAKVAGNDEVLVDIAEGVRVRVLRGTITTVIAKTEPIPPKSGTKGDKDESAEAGNDEPETVEADGGDKSKGSARRVAGGK